MSDSSTLAHVIPALTSIVILFVFTPSASSYMSSFAIPTYRRRHHLYKEIDNAPAPLEADLEAYSKYAASLVGTMGATIATLVGLIVLQQLSTAAWIGWLAGVATLAYLGVAVGLFFGYVPFKLHPGDYSAGEVFLIVPQGTALGVFAFDLVTLLINLSTIVLGEI